MHVAEMEELEEEYRDDLLTLKGFKRKRCLLLLKEVEDDYRQGNYYVVVIVHVQDFHHKSGHYSVRQHPQIYTSIIVYKCLEAEL